MSYLPIGGSGGGGFKLGPAQNIFDAGSGDLAAAEKLRDDYATANPSWLAEYDGNSELNVLLLYTDSGSPVGTYFVRSGNEWRLNSSVKGLRGPKGDQGPEGPAGSGGLPDNGSIDDLSSDFKSLAVGKWYVDGWQNSSNLPNDWSDEDRVAALTVFGGYEGTDNGAYWILASHRKGIYSAVTSAGVTSDWYKLDNADPQPLVTRGFNVDASNPGEIIAADGSNHDVIAINGENDLVLGSRSSTIKSLALATHARHITAYHADDDGVEVFDTLAFTSDLNKTSQRLKRTLYIRGEGYTITEEDIQKDLFIQAEPFLKDAQEIYSTTVTFPSIEVMKKYYYIPGVNEDKNAELPHIQNLTIEAWIAPESPHSDGENRLYLKSVDNSFAWGTSTKIGDPEGCFIHRPANDKSRNDDVCFRFMKIEVGSSDTGPMAGYTLQSAGEDNVFSLTTTPPVKTDVNNAVNLRLSVDEQGNEYVSIDRSNPVKTSEQVDNLTLIRIVGAETDETLPIVAKVEPGKLGSGFSLCEDGTQAGAEILQVSSGTYTLDQMPFALTAPVGALVYIGENGRLTINASSYVAGWVIEGGVIIDIDIYNASLNTSGSGNLPTDPTFNSVTANSIKTELIETDTTKIDFDVSGGVVMSLSNDELALTKTAHNNQGTEITGIYRLIGSGETAHVALPNDNMVLYAEGLIALQDTGSDYIYFDRINGLNFSGTSGYLCADYDGNGIYVKGRNAGFKSMDGNPVMTMGESDGYSVNMHNHKLFNVGAPTKDKDAANKAYVDALESRITTLETNLSDLTTQVSGLQQLLISEGQRITDLQTSNGNSVTNFTMYSSKSDEIRMDMDRINGQGLTQTITLGSAPHPEPPEPPNPDQFTVYFGWDINPRGMIQASDIVDYEGTDERSADLFVSADTLLTTTFEIDREGTENKYGYVAYPKDVVENNPYHVEYSGFVAEWPARELLINGTVYIALVSTWPNSSPNLTLKLHQ